MKFRGKVLFDPGGVEVGVDGNRVTAIMAGSVAGCHGPIASSAVGSGSFVVAGITANHKVLVSIYSATDSCQINIVRVVPSADTITASFANFVGTDASTPTGDVVIHYLAILDK